MSYYILLYLRKFVHNAADLLDAHIVPMRWDVHNIWWVEFKWWGKFWHSWFPPMVRGTYEAFTSLDVWANIHVYGKQPFVLNVTVLFQICLLPGSSQHPRTRALTGIRLLLFWVLGFDQRMMNTMTRLMHISTLWVSVLLFLCEGLCFRAYKWGICLNLANECDGDLKGLVILSIN